MLLASYFPGSANAWSINHTDSALLNEVVVTPWEPRVVRTRDWFRAEDNRVPVGVSLTVEGHHVAPWGEGEDSADTVPFVRIVRYTPGYAAASSDMHWEPSKARVSDSLCAGAWFTSSPRIGWGKPRLVG